MEISGRARLRGWGGSGSAAVCGWSSPWWWKGGRPALAAATWRPATRIALGTSARAAPMLGLVGEWVDAGEEQAESADDEARQRERRAEYHEPQHGRRVV